MSSKRPVAGRTQDVAPNGAGLTVSATIVIPFHRNLEQLRRSVGAARGSMPEAEIVIAADGAREDCRPVAATFDARVVEVAGPSGPATARNRAAAQARGDVLLFVDTDVVAAPDALPGLCRFLAEQPEVDGVFGAYDLEPAEPNFMSQFKNLSHRYVHEMNGGEASTFWAGLGAVRTSAFRRVGGFDERFPRPSIEDIELGCRLVAGGHALVLDPRFQGTHLKRWTLGSVVSTDLWARGIPWTQLIHRAGAPRNGLNLRAELRLSVVAAFVFVLSVLLLAVSPWFAVLAGASCAALVLLNGHFYRWLARHRGLSFAMLAVPAHLIHHVCNGVSFVVGTLLYHAARAGWQLPGALPLTAWDDPARVGAMTLRSVGR